MADLGPGTMPRGKYPESPAPAGSHALISRTPTPGGMLHANLGLPRPPPRNFQPPLPRFPSRLSPRRMSGTTVGRILSHPLRLGMRPAKLRFAFPLLQQPSEKRTTSPTKPQKQKAILVPSSPEAARSPETNPLVPSSPEAARSRMTTPVVAPRSGLPPPLPSHRSSRGILSHPLEDGGNNGGNYRASDASDGQKKFQFLTPFSGDCGGFASPHVFVEVDEGVVIFGGPGE